jgi:SAM-dependent methyltransferase
MTIDPRIPPLSEPYREFELDGWERAAAHYADSFERATAPFVEPLLDALGVGERCDVLDLACGTGRLAARAAARGAHVTGADFSANMLRHAQARAPGSAYVRADAERLPFAAQSFDAVAINFGVHHFPFPLRALAEAQRILRQGGRLAFTIWAAPDVNPVQTLVFDAIRAVGAAAPALPPPPGGGVTDGATCRRLLRQAGFVSSQIEIAEVQALLNFASGRALIDMLREGTVQTAAVINAQASERMGAIEAEIARSIERYRDGDVLRVPALALLVSAAKAEGVTVRGEPVEP